MQKKLLATFALALASVVGYAGGASADSCGQVIGNATDGIVSLIAVDTTWGLSGDVCLEEPVYVSNGTANGPRLTILPGTIVRGQPRRAAVGSVNNNPGALIIGAGARLISDGTPTAPIIMTTAAVDNDNDGTCDNLDAGLGNTFKDPFPGLDPNVPAGCAATNTCTTPCTGGCVPLFCDNEPTVAPLAPLGSDGLENVQLWGGLALAGCAPTNAGSEANVPTPNTCKTDTKLGSDLLEGVQIPQTSPLLAVYGGNEPHDNSGVIRYTSVRHAGDPLTEPGDELNGVTLAGIGDGTIYEYVEVYTNWDDGHEWFGGTVNGNHLVTAYAGDDQFDLDQGYTGALQYLFTVMPFFKEDGTGGAEYGSGSGERMGEWDGLDRDNTIVRREWLLSGTDNVPWPFPYSYIWNLTGIGAVPDGTNLAGTPRGTGSLFGLYARNGFAGSTLNSIVVNLGGSVSCFQVDPLTTGAPPGYDASDNVSNDLIRLVSSICSDTGAPDATAVSNGDAYAERETGDPTSGDTVTLPGPVLVQEDPAFNPRGNSDGKLDSSILDGRGPYDPRPTGAAAGLVGIQPQDTGLDRAGTIRGAFEADTSIELWTTPWTALNQGGVLAD